MRSKPKRKAMALMILVLYLIITIFSKPAQAGPPAYVELQLPYFTQNLDFCLVASVQMALSYIMPSNATLPDQYQLDKEMLGTPGQGTYVEYAVRPFWKRGYINVQAVATQGSSLDKMENLTIDYIKTQLSNGYPFIVSGYFNYGGEYEGARHAVVVVGYDETGLSKQIMINDPKFGTPKRLIEYSTFERWWSIDGIKAGLKIPYKAHSTPQSTISNPSTIKTEQAYQTSLMGIRRES